MADGNSESGIALLTDELNNVSTSCSNNIGSEESKDYSKNDQFETLVSENDDDDDCYVVADIRSTPVKLRNHETEQSVQGVSFVEYVDLTQEDEPEETKFQDSFVHKFTKDTRLCILQDVIPDADPDFLMRKVNEFKTDDDLQLFVLSALENQDYPKLGAIHNIVPNQTGKSARGPDNLQNEDVSKYNLKSPNPINLNSTNTDPSDRGKRIEGPSVPKISTPVIPKISHSINSECIIHASPTQEQSYTDSPFAIINMKYSGQRLDQTRIAKVSAKPHTVTSQEVLDHTSSYVPQSVTSHVEQRNPGFSVQDIRDSQQGLGTSLSTYIPSHTIVSSFQTENNDNPFNTTVNISEHPFTSSGQIIASNTRAPHATRTDEALLQGIENFFWVPWGFDLMNSIQTRNSFIEQRRVYYEEERGLHRHDYFNVVPRYEEDNEIKLVDLSSNSIKEKGENKSFNLLSDILNLANPEFLRIEAKKLKNDDDVVKFLIRSIANEELWKKCVTAKNSDQRILRGSARLNRYKILLELLPDAKPTFLKLQAAKLKNDDEVHEFAMKLGREQTYPKRRSPESGSNNKSNKRKLSVNNESERIDPKYQTLLDLLPDADPDFLLQESKMLESPEDIQEFVLTAVENNTYPKRDQFLERQEYQKQWKKYIENFNIKEFLQIIPNPVKFFYIDKVNSKNPLDMPGKFLQHRYRRKCDHYFNNFFSAAKHSLTKTCDILDVHYKIKPRKYIVWDQKTIFSTSILQEIAFIQNKKEIAHYLLFKEEMKSEAYEKGKTEGTLQECSCCYDEKLAEDMTSCSAGHMYCLNCIKRGSEVVIGNGGTKFPCYTEGCEEEFSLDILKTVLNPEVFSRLLIRKQYEEVNAAGIPGLETCSFCEFCSIPPAEDKLFRCLNPSCMKVTCRSCKKLDHLPLSCEEFIQKETRHKMQSYVEDKMTEALVRTCWQCGTKFIKENGCNMMKCKCGAKMCYFCRQPVENYEHFGNGSCGQYLDTTAHDEATVIKVGKKAKQEIEAANPGYSLPNDPTKLLHVKPKKQEHEMNYYF